MEFIRPEIVDLGSGRSMLLFLRNMSGAENRNDRNASTLVWAIREADGTWAKDANGNIASNVIENDGEADSTFSALRVGDKVYISWTNAVVADDFADNLDSAKASLQSSDIHMTVFDCVTQTFSGEIIEEITVKAGETTQLSATAYPWDGLKDLSYYSFDSGVAMVSPDGTVIGMGEGSTYLIVEDMSSVPLYKRISVNVLPADEETDSYLPPIWDILFREQRQMLTLSRYRRAASRLPMSQPRTASTMT